jgi:hypothetical protein
VVGTLFIMRCTPESVEFSPLGFPSELNADLDSTHSQGRGCGRQRRRFGKEAVRLNALGERSTPHRQRVNPAVTHIGGRDLFGRIPLTLRKGEA